VVSRVCNPKSKGYVSEAARQRVLEAIQALGYRPDSRAQFLHSGRTSTIGFYSGNGTLRLEIEFARALLDGLQSACEEMNIDLLIFHNVEHHSPQEIAAMLANSKVDGIVHHPSERDAPLSHLLSSLSKSKPMVRIGEPYPGIPAVLAEDQEGGRRMARHLFDRGHRRVLFRREPFFIESARRRYAGFCQAAERLGMSVVATAAEDISDDLTTEEQRLLRNFRAEGITAVASWRDWSAAKVLLFCEHSSINVPKDIAVVGFDGMTPEFCPDTIRLTTLVIEWQRIAGFAVERLFDLIENRPVPEEVIHPCSLYIGNTT